MAEHLTDDQIWDLGRCGHDYRKLYATFRAATARTGQPTVILAKTVKGWTLGSHFEGRNSTHQMKKLTLGDLKDFRDRLHLPIADEALDATLPRTTGHRRDPRNWTTSTSAGAPWADGPTAGTGDSPAR